MWQRRWDSSSRMSTTTLMACPVIIASTLDAMADVELGSWWLLAIKCVLDERLVTAWFAIASDYSVSDEMTAFAIGDVDLDGKLTWSVPKNRPTQDGAMPGLCGQWRWNFAAPLLSLPVLVGSNGIAIGDIDGYYAPDSGDSEFALRSWLHCPEERRRRLSRLRRGPMSRSSRNVTAALFDGAWICRPRLDWQQQLAPTIVFGKPQGAFTLLVSHPVDTTQLPPSSSPLSTACTSIPTAVGVVPLGEWCWRQRGTRNGDLNVSISGWPDAVHRPRDVRMGYSSIHTVTENPIPVVGSSASDNMGGMGDGSAGPLRRDRDGASFHRARTKSLYYSSS